MLLFICGFLTVQSEAGWLIRRAARVGDCYVLDKSRDLIWNSELEHGNYYLLGPPFGQRPLIDHMYTMK